MSNSVKSRWLSFPLLALSLQYCLAQAPSGEVDFSFNAANTAIYDLTANYTLSADIIGAGGTPTTVTLIDVPVTHTRTGQLKGVPGALIIVQIGDGDSASYVAAKYTLTGRVSGGGSKATSVRMNFHCSGKDTVAGVPNTSFNISVNYNLQVNPSSMAMEGTARGHVSLGNGLSGGNINSDNVSVPLPPGVDGTWSAQLNLVSLGKLGGSGNVVLSSGRILPMKVAGSFSVNTQLSTVHLTGIQNADGDGRGNSVRIIFPTSATQPTQPNFVGGTLLGQKVDQ